MQEMNSIMSLKELADRYCPILSGSLNLCTSYCVMKLGKDIAIK
jgi:Fe-S-cluster containining protein